MRDWRLVGLGDTMDIVTLTTLLWSREICLRYWAMRWPTCDDDVLAALSLHTLSVLSKRRGRIAHGLTGRATHGKEWVVRPRIPWESVPRQKTYPRRVIRPRILLAETRLRLLRNLSQRNARTQMRFRINSTRQASADKPSLRAAARVRRRSAMILLWVRKFCTSARPIW